MVYLAAVRFGRMNNTENFLAKFEGLKLDDQVVARTSRGVEIGNITAPVTEQDRADIKGLGEILRKATSDDLRIAEHIHAVKEPGERRFCEDQIEKLQLPMKLADVEHLFGGDKIIFYFLADGRVDFRELVKTLAKEYRTRIEMRQIGVRDEARLLADYEHCGRELCCRTFMTNLEPVMMRMAKLQKTTLDPSKISGHCGRLMCCLRFEDDVYADLKRNLPPKGSFIRTEDFEGEVLDYNILKQTCYVEAPNGDRETIHVDDIVERRGRGGKARKKESQTGRQQKNDDSDNSSESKGNEPEEKSQNDSPEQNS